MEKMTHYIGAKILMAIGMTLGTYNAYRGWKMPENEDANSDGYLVEYLDGGKPNHLNHVGYISWSPKNVFEGSYVAMGDVSDLAPHQQRVVAEQAALNDKLSKLVAFFDTAIYAGLADDEKDRLSHQGSAMQEYSNILGERIDAFNAA
jgi:hypothetical protein